MSDYIISKLHDKYQRPKPESYFVDNDISLKCCVCKQVYKNTNIQEFFLKLYCDPCLERKKKQIRINLIIKQLEGKK
ncbi:MAG: hypothetical protein ACRCW9_04065 [Cetobacterium sp.]